MITSRFNWNRDSSVNNNQSEKSLFIILYILLWHLHFFSAERLHCDQIQEQTAELYQGDAKNKRVWHQQRIICWIDR